MTATLFDDLPPLPHEAEGADHPDDADLPLLRAVSEAQLNFAIGSRRRTLSHCREYLEQAEKLVRTWREKGEPEKALAAQRDLAQAARGFEKLRRMNSAAGWLDIRKAEPHALLMGLGGEPEGE